MITLFLIISTLLCRNTESLYHKTTAKLKVEVSFLSSSNSFKPGEDIVLRIKLQNQTSQVQKFLFDIPELSTGGPWSTAVSLTRKSDGQDQVEQQNKAILSSHVYSHNDLQDKYYELKPKEILIRTYHLSDLVVFKQESLRPGTYLLRLWFERNSSNILEFTIE